MCMTSLESSLLAHLLWTPVQVPGRISLLDFSSTLGSSLSVTKEQVLNILIEVIQRSLTVLNITIGLHGKLTGLYTYTLDDPKTTVLWYEVCDRTFWIHNSDLFHPSPSQSILFLQLYLHFPLCFFTVFFSTMCKASLNHLRNRLCHATKTASVAAKLC